MTKFYITYIYEGKKHTTDWYGRTLEKALEMFKFWYSNIEIVEIKKSK